MREPHILRRRRSGSRALAFLAGCLAASACQFALGDLPANETVTLVEAGAPGAGGAPDTRAEAGKLDSGGDGGTGIGGQRNSPDADLESGIVDASEAGDSEASEASVPESGTACLTPVPWYPDGDADGYGRSGEGIAPVCPKPDGKWARLPGDCADGNPLVHPDQKRYFGDPYTLAGGGISFDYDCSQTEDGNPEQQASPACGVLALTLCGGTGYAKTSRAGTPPAVNAVCGSTVISTCRAALAILICETVNEPATEPYRCR